MAFTSLLVLTLFQNLHQYPPVGIKKINFLNHSLYITPQILTGPSTHFPDFPGVLLMDNSHYTLTCTYLSEVYVNDYQCKLKIPLSLSMVFPQIFIITS